jgi:opacity protein-like surface antigen
MLILPTATLLTLLSLASPLAPPAVASEQRPAGQSAQSGAVAAAAPVYLLPDATRTPLRTLPAGTVVRIGEVREDWVQVTFNDGALGARTGWMERRYVTIGPTVAEPPRPAVPPPAQPRTTQTRPAARRRTVWEPTSGRAFGTVMFDKMAAADSFDAVIGKTSLLSYGAGVQATNVWQGVFVEASYERTPKQDGERVFVHEGEVFPLGIPIEIDMNAIDVVAGWRHPLGPRLHAYGGGGVTWFTYQETSEFSDEDENVDERKTGYLVLAGIEVGLARWVHARGEVRFRSVDNILGVGGASAAFDEDKLGGVGVGVKIVVGR